MYTNTVFCYGAPYGECRISLDSPSPPRLAPLAGDCFVNHIIQSCESEHLVQPAFSPAIASWTWEPIPLEHDRLHPSCYADSRPIDQRLLQRGGETGLPKHPDIRPLHTTALLNPVAYEEYDFPIRRSTHSHLALACCRMPSLVGAIPRACVISGLPIDETIRIPFENTTGGELDGKGGGWSG